MGDVGKDLEGRTSIIIPESFPLTIREWRAAQLAGDGLDRLINLVERERQINSTAWIALATPEQVKSQWSVLQIRPQNSTMTPLWGVPFAVKDNIDAEGFPTTAACPAFAGPPSTSDATVVAKLKEAGAILIGKTNLDQFATGLVGTRSPYGAVPNSFDSAYVSGGSSSGSAVVVGRGVVPFSLGTDTAGSGRVPAGLNNIVGLKATRGSLSAEGVVPACKSLDCVSIFALTIDDTETILAVAEGIDAKYSYSRKRPDEISTSIQSPRIAICQNPPWFGRSEQEHAYLASLEKARSLGWTLEEVDFSPLFELANLLYEGPWVAERYEAIRDFITRVRPDEMDPVVRGIVMKAENFSAADVFKGEYRRQELTREIERLFEAYDALLVPTTPTFPTIHDLAQRPVLENSILGTYTNFVNFLDWTAIAIPAGFRSDGLPFGITIISRTWAEPKLLDLSRRWANGEKRPLGATNRKIKEPVSVPVSNPSKSDFISLAVVGAHLSGFPLNKDLTSRGATLELSSTTSARYRLYALNSKSGVRKPGLKRVDDAEDGTNIEVEVWQLPKVELGSFMATISHPLGLGSVELKSGDWTTGFVCEPIGLQDAVDITSFGGWRPFMASIVEPLGGNAYEKDAAIKRRIETILIANRGEIALRIIRTLHALGLKAVAIYSDQDASAPHVKAADVSLHLEGGSVSDTYLNSSRILKLAQSVQADAIIPGYGFLSENADFAAAVEDAGMVWIGPTPEQMSQLGLKHEARAIAIAAGVPVVPGSDKLLVSIEEACEAAKKVGYPVMLKSTAGGGGIGLRRCEDEPALREVLGSVQRLAKANFGNDGVLLEHCIQHARHIEVQVLGDGTGQILIAGERDCSLQRRHQKVLEESPAPTLPSHVRTLMHKAAKDLTSSVNYRNVGTVEFIYDIDTQKFYFLEVNTRLQVEHPVTESVTGLDLVECMVIIARGDGTSLFESGVADLPVTGTSIEARVYAENPLQNFHPSAGKVLDVQFPSGVRVDTWIDSGTEVTSSYDPMLAKVIATGKDRQSAVRELTRALTDMKITGIETNLPYLLQIISSKAFQSDDYTTHTLDVFEYHLRAFEVIEAGNLTTIQDYPGRTGFWHAGIPPSGPMDNYSFQLANRLVGNVNGAAALECTIQGPTLRFHDDMVVAVTGAAVPIQLDGQHAPHNSAFLVRVGQTLSVGTVQDGYRIYVAIRGGIEVPMVLGSRSTFELGKFGGFNGRKLQAGDVVRIGSSAISAEEKFLVGPIVPIPPQPEPSWNIRVTPGPHGAPDYFTADGLATLFEEEWKVHYNSNRLGIRLTGPKPKWARSTGGEAGLHPSNIHDSPYSVGGVSFTGDEAVVLTCDGPSLGGFVVWCTVIAADMWKLGQLRSGDRIKFQMISVAEAVRAADEREISLEKLKSLDVEDVGDKDQELEIVASNIPSTIIGDIGKNGETILVRQAGDHAMLLEFGSENIFDLRQSLAIFAFIERHKAYPIPGVKELSPGVRTLHVIYALGILPEQMLQSLASHSYTIPSKVPSRKFQLPFAFDDSACKKAVQRYAETIRSEAPWLPSNTKFLQELNGLEDGAVETMLKSTEFLVLGLGDVFMGSPCAVPLDPRHRLFGTKYNPSRSFTPQGAVGIGGNYLCIYAGDSPGGYQLVGSTVIIWDEQKLVYRYKDEHEIVTNGIAPNGGHVRAAGAENPWMFRLFDRVSFYPVDEAELKKHKHPSSAGYKDLIRVEEGGVLDVEEYEEWLKTNKTDIEDTTKRRGEAISKAPFLDELLKPYKRKEIEGAIETSGRAELDNIDGEKVRAILPGRVFRCEVEEGSKVSEGGPLLWIESNKMEIKISSPVSGTVAKVAVNQGDLVSPGEILVIIA